MKSVRIGFSPLVLALVLLYPAAGPSRAAEQPPGLDFGVLGGFVLLDEDLAGPDGPATEPALGVRIGGPFFARDLRWFADTVYYEVNTDTFRRDAQAVTLRAGAEVSYFSNHLNPLILTLAGGYASISFDNATDYDSMLTSVGIGQRIWAGGNKHIRWELRADHSLASDGLMGEDVNQLQLLVGLSWMKRSRPRDSDDDGIVDRLDECPESLPGEGVDGRGCPWIPRPADPTAPGALGSGPGSSAVADTDADGVSDSQDRCPRTVRGTVVGEDGCALDADGDGVYDGLGMDKCPDTPAGAVVDHHGCPLDGDGDGIWDGLDRCPDTPPGGSVNEEGCPAP
jgi:hypothetical protein